MPDPIQIIDHDAQAQARTAEQYRNKVAFAAVIEAHDIQFQEIENMLWDLYTLRTVDTAEGTQLDTLGKIVGELRGGVSDQLYRLRVRARIRANLSNGTIENIYVVIRALIGAAALPGVTFTWTQSFPAGFILAIGGYVMLPAYVSVFAGFVRDSRGAAIEAHLGWQETDDAHAFNFFDGPGLGFGDDSDPTIGGALVGIVKV